MRRLRNQVLEQVGILQLVCVFSYLCCIRFKQTSYLINVAKRLLNGIGNLCKISFEKKQ